MEIEVAMIGVHHDEKTLVDVALAAAGEEFAGGAAEQIALLPVAQADELRIVGRSLDTAIPAEIRLVAVAVVFAIGFVVLLLVADEVLQREPVMRRNEVDARPRPPPAIAKDVGGAGD